MSGLKNELRFHAFQIRQNFNNKRVLKTSFMVQIISMCLSNTSFFIIWIMFSKTIGVQNGWGPLQTFGMLSVCLLVFGLTHSVFGSLISWFEKVPSGALDSMLNKPKSVYIRLMNNEFGIGAIGDILQGALGLVVFFFLDHTSLLAIIKLGLLIIPSILIEISFIMAGGCTMLWLPQAGSLPAALNNLILAPATQPISMLRGTLRYLYLFAIPALVISGLPIESIQNTGWAIFALSYGISLAWLAFSVWLLNISLRRYESGNSIGA